MSSMLYRILRESRDPRHVVGRVLSTEGFVYTSDASAFLLKTSLDLFRAAPDLHLSLLKRIPGETIAGFVPGLMSRYFALLKDDKIRSSTREAAVASILHVLSSIPGLDEASEEHILAFFCFNNRSEFQEIYAACAGIFGIKRKTFFLVELMLRGHELLESEYAVINENLEEYFHVGAVERLVDIGKYRNNECVFKKIKEMYLEGEDVDGLIQKIQSKFEVGDPVLELCSPTELVTREVLETNDLGRIEKFVGNAAVLPLECEVVKKYLLLSMSHSEILESSLGQRFDVRRIIRDNYEEFLEFAFEMIGSNMNVIISLVSIEFRPKLDDFIFRSLDLISQCGIAEDMAQHLYFIRMAVEKNCLRRPVLKRIFDELVYVDHEDYRVRCAKYEIFDSLLEQYRRMDELLAKNRSSGVPSSTAALDKDNVFVLAATLWEELSILPIEEELVGFLTILKRIVDVTSSFYEPRMERSGLVLSLTRMLDIKGFSEARRRRLDAFISFTESVAREFVVSKKTFEALFHFLVSYHRISRIDRALEMLVRKDRFYGLYLFSINRRRMSEGLRESLIKAFSASSECSGLSSHPQDPPD
jgi:hypothetical protein